MGLECVVLHVLPESGCRDGLEWRFRSQTRCVVVIAPVSPFLVNSPADLGINCLLCRFHALFVLLLIVNNATDIFLPLCSQIGIQNAFLDCVGFLGIYGFQNFLVIVKNSSIRGKFPLADK